jgi:photoactive yellow protein
VIDPASLDGLAPDELDALDVGVIKVDGRGFVQFYSASESRFSGLPVERVLGRNFFRDVVPCTNVPAFYGRFADGVRRADLDAQFSFVFRFDPDLVRVAVQMASAAEADRYWIVVRPLQRLAPGRRDDATRAVARRTRAEPVDPGFCEREPIHIPGAIQPHAALLAVDPVRMTVLACSENVADVLGPAAGSAPGRSIDEVLPAALAGRIIEHVRSGRLSSSPVHERTALSGGDLPLLVSIHFQAGRIIIEIEPLATHPADFGAPDPIMIQDAVSQLRRTPLADALARAAAITIRDMTGFERVLVYRFDQDWNGEAIAESLTESWSQSLAGLRFPASDIPAQARALYTRSPGRFVVDRDYVPMRLVAEPGTDPGPVDLTFAQWRSLSPVHLEYQRNLGVNGSMSASILVDGRLWGLVIGHHRKPHYVPPETRAAVATLAETLGLRLGEIERGALWQAQQEHLRTETLLLQQMAGADDLSDALSRGGAGLLDLFGATGAALVVRDQVTPFGVAPDPEVIAKIAAWARETVGSGLIAVTDRLSEVPAAPKVPPAVASGLLLAFADETKDIALAWFRPEVVGTVSWGGDPRKAVTAKPGSPAALPRRSFERWVEERRGQSDPWSPWQIEIAASLAAAMKGVVLRQSRKVAELTSLLHDRERLLAQKEVLSREIDHRVKNSLQIVSSFLQMQARSVADADARAAFSEAYARVMSVARVHNSLYQSEDVEEVDLGHTVESLCMDLSELTGGDGGRIEVAATRGVMVPYRTGVALALIATELVTNAFKYACSGADACLVRVAVAVPEGGGICLSVSDNGPGLPNDWKTRPKRGLGMRLINAMLAQIGATMDITSSQEGALFTISA